MRVSETPRDPIAHDSSVTGPLPLGVTLDGKYHVERVLGQGSMGIVYLGMDEGLERDVAIKVLLPKYAADERVAQRFKLEAVAMAAVRAENVVQIFSYGEYAKHPYFVMEYLPGYTVASLIDKANERGEQLYLDVVLGVLRQVCRGLQTVHDLGIVHRDIKPANMLVGPNFRVAITDFGLVETIHASSERDLAGTPLYLAPELIRRQQLSEDLRFRADIYALAISTYEMFTGDVPFDGTSIKEILRRHLHDTPAPLSDFRTDLPPGIDEVLRRALSKNPEDRHATCGEFVDDLESARTEVAGGEAPRSGWPRVLIVDDESETRTVFRTAIKVGYPQASVFCASDGFQGWELARAGRPDIVLVDLNMPGMNGLELVAAFQGDEMLADVPLVVISAEIDARNRKVLESLGVRHFLHKPVELAKLVGLVRQIAGRPT